MKRKVHVIPHTHWDREWYFNTSRSSVYLMNNLTDVINTLERDASFTYFMLDAQGSLLDDYSKWMPQNKDRIYELVKQHRLIIGPWYTQSDQMVVSGESIVRNLYYGIKTCESYGGYMNVAYVPDSFGQAGNMPQIYRGFGIVDTLFWRGVSNDMVTHTDFIWRGDDGSEVFTTQIPFGYYIGGNIPEDEAESKTFWEQVCLKKAGTGATRHIYFPHGFDQAPIRHNLPELLKKRNEVDVDNEYVISCIEDYIRDVKSEQPKLDVVEGELLNAKHMRIHRSIFSSRSDLKQLNTKVQNYVTNILEPILTLSNYLGNDYPREAVKEIWKLLFENAAHDSIGSCISDSANEDVYLRYKKAQDIAENLVELHERYMATKVKFKKDACMSITIFKTLPEHREDVLVKEFYMPEGNFSIVDYEGNEIPYCVLKKEEISDYVLSQTIRLNPSKKYYMPKQVVRATIAIHAKHLPPVGFVQLYVVPSKKQQETLQTQTYMENEYYTIHVQENGLLKIVDKRNGYSYHDQCEYLENGDDGDSFNYSPPRKDMIISSKNTLQDVQIKGTSYYQTMEIHHCLQVPYDLNKRAQRVCSNELSIITNIELKANDSTIYVTCKVHNTVLSHRLCVVFDSDMTTKCNFADEQFGIIRRDNVHEEDMRLYEEACKHVEHKETTGPLNWANAQDSWQEPSISIEPCQSFVSLSCEDRSIAVFPGGVREYEIVGERKNKVCLTLFRTYGFMGKENLLYRPGRASGEKIIETPAAQLIKEMTFDFGFMTSNECFNKSAIAQCAKRYQTPCEVYAYADFLNGRLIFVQEDSEQRYEPAISLWEVKKQHVVLSAMKKCEDKKGYILRFFNPFYKQSVSDELHFNVTCKNAYYVDLLEQQQSVELRFEKHTIYLDHLAHCKFVSVYVECE